jgi:transcriptional regulator of nitric oxide reductase
MLSQHAVCGRKSAALPEVSVAAKLFQTPQALCRSTRQTGNPPSWRVFDGRLIGYIAATSEVAGSVGYSGVRSTS